MNDSRLEDYLNDKLQTYADFEVLDSLLATVHSQQALLRKQLLDADRDVKAAKEASAQHEAALQQQARAFQAHQAAIDKRLMIVTQSDASDDAVQRFELSLDKIHRLDVANGYLDLLSDVGNLSNEATAQLKISPESALDSYTRLRDLVNNLQPLQTDAEGAAPHLLDYIDKTTLTLRKTIRDAFAVDLDTVLKKILWPKPRVALPESVQTEWERAVKRLLALQKPELESQDQQDTSEGGSQESLVLLPLEVMVQPLELRFRYHFSGDRTTNRLDKPEYFFSHILDLLQSHFDFVNDYLQPVLLEYFKGSQVTLNPVYIDAPSALITSLLPMLRVKVLSLISQVSSQPQLLSHLIHELMKFDTTLRDEWSYTGSTTSPTSVWKGLAWEVLVQHDWFGRWLQVEKDFALARYQSIIDTPDSSTLDYDSVDRNVTKPTKAAIRVNDLLETITNRYRPLSSFSQKLRFLIDIQISIFDRFHNRLSSSLEAYLSLTTGLGRTVQGVSAGDLTSIQGVSGLDRLCRVFGSAEYLEKAMRDWSDDVFFLDLWSELQTRVRDQATSHRSPTTATTGKGFRRFAGLSIADVASRTSNTLASFSSTTEKDDTAGAIFDETAGAYARLRARSEGVIIERLSHGVRETLRAYARINPWPSLATADVDASTPTLDLQGALDLLNESLAFLVKALGALPLRRIARTLARLIDSFVLDRIILTHLFAMQGARQIRVDVEALAGTFERLVGGNAGSAGMKRCFEAVQLLCLPIRGSGRAGSDDEEEDAAWGETEEGMEVTQEGEEREGEQDFGLWQVEKRLFESNESAREVLEEMGLEALSESEARQVLQRRVELAS